MPDLKTFDIPLLLRVKHHSFEQAVARAKIILHGGPMEQELRCEPVRLDTDNLSEYEIQIDA